MYKYLLWDIDGTIIDFLSTEKAAIKALFIKYGFGECSDEKVAEYSKINIGYWEKLERGEMTKPEILVERFRDFFAKNGIDVSLAEQFNDDYQYELGETHEMYDNADEVLANLMGEYVLAAVTNGTKLAQTKKLRDTGLDRIFDYVCISEDIGYEKPDRKYFDKVFEIMKIEDKKKVLIIGDSLTSDILGGINAGIDTCWYNQKGIDNNKGYSPTYEISNLNQICNILNQEC